MPIDDRWIALSPLLDEVLDLEPAARPDWLSALRAVDASAAGAIESLLEEQRAIGEGFLAGAAPRPPSQSAAAGDRVGAYTLRALIGEGGMGTVWLADRTDGQFERPVAVKFLSAALGVRGRARFQREGAILARLAHPNIAQLLDAGVTAKGRPYLVLELVEGEPIDRYCASRGLDLESRIRLLLDVIAAVAHAHAALIVHRDLKPSNVLVRSDGTVKLLDFGIAKLLDEGGSSTPTALTRELGGALTPEYAAPEQVTGQPITAATDVYALGVLAYELLTGAHPTAGTARAPASVVKAIVDAEPRRASDAAPAQAARLRGDLDTILARALKKSPGERYPTAAALGDDLQRHLRHQPVAARPDTLRYRARKFVRRNRVAVSLAALTLVATAAGVAGTLVQAAKARAERDYAVQQLARAEAVNDLDNFVLYDAAPAGKAFTVNDLLAAAEHIVRRQRGDDVNRVGLLVSIGRQYQVGDEDGKARAILQEAYQQSLRLTDVSTRARAACSLAQARARETGGQAEAERLYDEAMRALPGTQRYVLDRIFCLQRGSEVAREAGHSKAGVARAEEALSLVAQAPFHSDVLEQTATREVAEALRVDGRSREAAAMMARAAASLTSLGRDDTQNAGTLYNNWGLTLNQLGRLDEAERVFRRALEISRDDRGEDSVSPMLLVNYARVLRDLRRLDEASDYSERAYDKARQAGDDVVMNQSLLVRGTTYRDRGDLRRAGEMFDEVEPRLRAHLPPGHIAFASLASERALLAQASGDVPAALAYAERALAIAEASIASGGQGRDYIPAILTRKAGIELQLGRTQAARADAERAVSLLTATVEPGTTSFQLTQATAVRDRARQSATASETARR